MTVDEVNEAVEEIRRIAWDDEKAHAWEDALYRLVLRALAKGNCDDPQACATAALKTAEISFHRWCA